MRLALAATLAAAALALSLQPHVAEAGAYAKGHCTVTVPDNWVASRTRIASPDKKLWANVITAPSAAEALNLELSMKAVKVSEDAHFIVLVSTASFAGQTNRQYHVITKTAPACLADVTAPAGPQEAQAKAIALTVRLMP